MNRLPKLLWAVTMCAICVYCIVYVQYTLQPNYQHYCVKCDRVNLEKLAPASNRKMRRKSRIVFFSYSQCELPFQHIQTSKLLAATINIFVARHALIFGLYTFNLYYHSNISSWREKNVAMKYTICMHCTLCALNSRIFNIIVWNLTVLTLKN